MQQGYSLSGRERNCCFLNLGRARFSDVSAISGLDFEDDGRAVGLADWDFDGDLDLWLVNRSAPQVRFLRNNLDGENDFLAVRLRGTTCNRDAIGARVEVHLAGEDGAPRVKTLRAGDGFLSQSSKWLHFGLSPRTEIERVVVRWPGGAAESFLGLQPGERYLLVQGSGQAEAWAPGRKPPTLVASSLHGAPPASPPRVVLGRRFAVPRLEYEPLEGGKDRHVDGNGEPLLLVLWASWCRPCVAELQELQAHEAELQDAGLKLLAVSLDDDVDGDVDAARAFAKQHGLTFPLGIAGTVLVDKLQLVHDQLFDRHLPIGLPSSFLIDADGRLAAIYRGPLDLSAVLQDMAQVLPLDGIALRNAALPFSGRWSKVPDQDRTLLIARKLVDEGFRAEGLDYVTRGKDRAKLLAHVCEQLLLQGSPHQAVGYCQQAVEADSTWAEAHHVLGLAFHRDGRPAEAVASFRKALAIRPEYAAPQNSLAWILATSENPELRDPQEALRWAKKYAEAPSRKEDPAALDTLAAAYAAAGEYAQAVKTLQAAIQLARGARNDYLLELLGSRIQLYEQGKPLVISYSAPALRSPGGPEDPAEVKAPRSPGRGRD